MSTEGQGAAGAGPEPSAARIAAWTADGFRLDGRTAVVTGAGGGLGRGFAIALAAAGADVALLDVDRDAIEKAAEEVVGTGRRAWPLVCDVTDAAQVTAAIDGLERVDVVVNNAGTNRTQPFVEISEENIDLMLALNVKGYLLVSQAAVRRMIAAGTGGAVVNVSSQMGHIGAPTRVVYCATKHAVEGMTKAMAVELAPQGVRVNALAPTFTHTPLTRPMLADEAFRADTLGRIPIGRFGEVEDITGAVVYLCSPAAAMVTGTSLVVDGGWTAQ